MPEPVPVLVAVERYRLQLEAREAQAMNRLIDAYRRAYARLSQAVDLLLLEIGESAPSAGQILRMERYKALMAQAVEELRGFSALTRNEIERAGELGTRLGEQHGRELISITAAGDARLAAAFNRLPAQAIESLLGFLDPAGPLYARLGELAPHTAGLVSDAITSGVALGYNPRKIAGIVQDAFGRGLTDALRFVRTAQVWSYREANRASYVANSDVVEGWYWHAHLGPRTCGSCLAMHGTFHMLDERLNDHHNGRCAKLPAVKGFPPPVQAGDGERWFAEQPEAFQLRTLGKSKLAAYRANKFTFGALSTESADAVYGPMRVETPLADLIREG